MTSDIDTGRDFANALRAYVHDVAAVLEIGLQAAGFDLGVPASAYLAMDWRLPAHPDRDLALLWDERHGWSAAVETHSGEDVIVLAYLGGDEVCPEPRRVVQFLGALRADAGSAGRAEPPALREAGGHHDLVDDLLRHRRKGTTVR